VPLIGQREAHLTGNNTDKVSLIGQREEHLTGHNTDTVSLIGQREAHLTGHNTDKVSLIGQREAHLTGHNTDKLSLICQRDAHLTGHNTESVLNRSKGGTSYWSQNRQIERNVSLYVLELLGNDDISPSIQAHQLTMTLGYCLHALNCLFRRRQMNLIHQ
jgi:shikimate 5-dehydrogenase